PAAFGAPPQPGEQLPREPLSIAAIGAAGMLLSPVALGLSALALRRHRRRPARGRSLAVAAATIAVAQLGVAAVAVPVALSWDSGEETVVAAEQTTEVEPADDAPDDGKAPSKDDPEWQDWHDEPDPDLPTATGPVMSVMLAPGDCFRPYEDAAGESDDEEVEVVEMAELVACDTPHPAEAIGYVDLLTPGAEWPGQEKLNDLAFQACDAMIAPYVLDVWKLASPEGDLAVNGYLPLQESWEKSGHRGVVCFLESPEADDSLTSGLRGDPASYNQTQRRYLRLTQGMETAVLSYPYNESPARVRDWADRIADEAEDQAVQLRGTVWDSPGAQAGALQLADARDAEAARWREVAAAPDETTLEERMEDSAAWEEALALEAEFRELIGLPTW
ncbi:septum formation family protein, partial [Streptomyces lonarensis]